MSRLPAKALITGLCAMLVATAANAAPGGVTNYTCGPGQELKVQRTESAVRVSLGERTYDLKRHRSEIGDKYLSSNAALIIDGASAVFVADDRLDLGTCVAAVPVASAR